MKNERQLLDEIRLREASLEDARRERDAGELTDVDFDAICVRETTSLDVARRALAALELPAATTERAHSFVARRRRRSRLIVALVCFALAAGMLVWANLGLRQAGSSATGGLNLSQTEKLQQLLTEAEADVANGDAATALSAYQQVLALQPKNVDALTEAGWFEFSAGSNAKNAKVVADGISLIRRALNLAPSQAAPRLYYAIVAYRTPNNQALATSQFEVFVKLHPTTAQLAIASPYLKALKISS